MIKFHNTHTQRLYNLKGGRVFIEREDDIKTILLKLIKAGKRLIENSHSTKGYSILFRNNASVGREHIRRQVDNASKVREGIFDLIDNILIGLLFRNETSINSMTGKSNLSIKKAKSLHGTDRQLSKFLFYRRKLFHDLSKKMANADQGQLTKSICENNIFERLVLLITHACQLRCTYCKVNKFPSTISKKVILKSIDLLLSSTKKNLTLQFFGGEPLLKFNLIKEAIEYAEKRKNIYDKNICYILTTNGIALTKEKVDYLKKHDVLIEFSFDGEVHTQLKNRKSSNGMNYYSIVMRNLQYLFKSKIPHYAICVTTPDVVSSLYRNFKYIAGIGFRDIQINYSLGVFWTEKKIAVLFNELKKMRHFIEDNRSRKVNLINLIHSRREPVVLNAELTVDCNGEIYLETGICLEEDFLKMKHDFFIEHIDNIKDLNLYFPTRFDTFYLLSRVYSKHNRQFRKVVLNNIALGMRIDNWMKRK